MNRAYYNYERIEQINIRYVTYPGELVKFPEREECIKENLKRELADTFFKFKKQFPENLNKRFGLGNVQEWKETMRYLDGEEGTVLCMSADIIQSV